MANSGMNPIIYAWKNRNFRRAFGHLLRCKAPDSHALIDDDNARQNMKRKSSSLPPSLAVPPPTPNSVATATSPPLSAGSCESHRPSITRYHATAFPLPPPPPSPQSPLQLGEPLTAFVTESTTTLTKCCLKVVELAGTKGSYILDNSQCLTDNSMDNNNDDAICGCMPINHPRIVINDDLSKNNFKAYNNNSCNDLFLSKLKNNASPTESIASAPMSPTGNLIVNILENLEAQQQMMCAPGDQQQQQQQHQQLLQQSLGMPQRIRRTLCASTCNIKNTNHIDTRLSPADCIVSISNEMPSTVVCSSNSLRNTTSIYCNRNAKSKSAPQRINCWSD